MNSWAQPFGDTGLSLFMRPVKSRCMGLSHSRGLAVGLFYPLDMTLNFVPCGCGSFSGLSEVSDAPAATVSNLCWFCIISTTS